MTRIRFIFANVFSPENSDANLPCKKKVYDEEYFVENPFEHEGERGVRTERSVAVEKFTSKEGFHTPTLLMLGYLYSRNEEPWVLRFKVIKRIITINLITRDNKLVVKSYPSISAIYKPSYATLMGVLKNEAPKAYLKYQVPIKGMLSLRKIAGRVLFLADKRFRNVTDELQTTFPEEVFTAIPGYGDKKTSFDPDIFMNII